MSRLKYVLFMMCVNICVYCTDTADEIYFNVDKSEGAKRNLYENSECRLNATHNGICKHLSNCPPALAALRDEIHPVMCGFDGTQVIVCCAFYSELGELPKNRTGISQLMCKQWQSQHCDTLPLIVVGGGVKATPREFPYMAAIGYGNSSDISWLCGGSLISERYVLSAAHCTETYLGMARWVRLGDLNINSNDDDARPEDFEIIRRINHPDYRPSLLYNDIALYQLDRAVRFNTYMKPVCLHTSYETPRGNGIATGWGRLGYGHPTSDHLMTVDLPFFLPNNCSSLIRRTSLLPYGVDEMRMVCAGEREGVKDTCQGDSGGPLVVNNAMCRRSQVGITSFGGLCGLADSPGIYTRVAYYVPWIESTVWH